MLISVQRTGKNQLESVQESMEDAILLQHSSLLRNPWSILTGVLEHCLEIETDPWFLIFGTFLSDRFPKATKDINVHFFIQRFTFKDEPIKDNSLAVINSCKLYHRIPRTFWSYLYEIDWEMRVISLHLKAPSPRRAQYAREHFVLRIVTSMSSKRKCISCNSLRHATSLF